jgi:hypothetical protein
LKKYQPDIIHIQSSFSLAPTSGEVYLDFLGNSRPFSSDVSRTSLSSDSRTISASYLARNLSEFLSFKPDPVIILDAINPREITETVLQMIYRNIFAQTLFIKGNLSAIIATGLFEHDSGRDVYVEMIKSLANMRPLGEIAGNLRKFSGYSSTKVQDAIVGKGINLLTNFPELTILPGQDRT